MNNTEQNIDKQKLYELSLILDQCKYQQKKKVKDDSILVLKNYQDFNPTMCALNINLLELQGNINVSFSGQIFNIYVLLRFLNEYPKTPPFVFLKNVDTKKFICNPIYKAGEVQNGLFIFVNQFLPSAKQWNQNYKIIQFLVEVQQQLSKEFPFFSSNQNSQIQQSQFIYNPQMQPQSIYQQNQQRISDPTNLWQQSQFQQQQQQPIQQQQQQLYVQSQFQVQQPQSQLQGYQQQTNPYSAMQYPQSQVQVVPQKNNNNIQNKSQEQSKINNNDETLTKKLKIFGASVFEIGKELLMTKEEKEQKLINDTKEKVDLEILNLNKKITETIQEQRRCLDQEIIFYQQQQAISRSQSQLDQQIKDNIQILDNQMVQYELGIEGCITMLSQQEQNNLEELIQCDNYSNQIIELLGSIQSTKEGLYYVQKKFIHQGLDYDSLIKVTKQLSQSLFENQLQLRKCLVQQF